MQLSESGCCTACWGIGAGGVKFLERFQVHLLARQLARERVDAGQLVVCCGLSPDEAALILAMRAPAM